MNSIVIQAVTVSDGTQYIPVFDAEPGNRQSNWFYIEEGTKPGTGRFLIRKSDWTKYLSTVQTATVHFTVDEDRTKFNTLTPDNKHRSIVSISVVIAGIVEYTETISTGDTMVEVIVHDRRFNRFHYDPKTYAYNVQKQGFPYDSSSDPEYFDSTTDSGTPWTWADVASDLGVTVVGTLPSVDPQNLIFDHESSGRAIQRFCDALYKVVGYNWIENELKLYNPDQVDATNASILIQLEQFDLLRGGSVTRTTRLPQTIRVGYHQIVEDESDPFSDRFVYKTYSTGITSGYTMPIHFGYMTAYKRSSTVLNDTELGTMTSYLGAALLASMSTDPDVKLFAGIWPLRLDGRVRAVKWTSNAHGAVTHVYINHVPHKLSVESDDTARLVHGYGSSFADHTPDRTTLVFAEANAEPRIVAKLTSNPPSTITADTKWSYTGVEAIDNGSGVMTVKTGGRTFTLLNLHEEQADSTYENISCTPAAPGTITRKFHSAGTFVDIFPVEMDGGGIAWKFNKVNPGCPVCD